MITRTMANEFEARLNSIVARYRPTHIIIGLKRKEFNSYEEAEQYCEKFNIDKNRIHKLNN
jgi:hypothetical protein